MKKAKKESGVIFYETRLGERLKQIRGSVSQVDFSAQIGLKQTTYSGYETGKKEPPLGVLAGIARKFGVTTDWLLGLSDSMGSGVSVQNRDGNVAIDHSKVETANANRLFEVIASQQKLIASLVMKDRQTSSPHADSSVPADVAQTPSHYDTDHNPLKGDDWRPWK